MNWSASMAVLTVSNSSLSSLKKALKDNLPAVKSSHVSEALAFALGFNTNIALKTQLSKTPEGWAAIVDEQRFATRLSQLVHVAVPKLSFEALIPNGGIPTDFARYLAQIAALQGQLGLDHPTIYALQDKCKEAFANYWSLGRPGPIELGVDTAVRHERGVDHSACQAGWGEEVRTLGLEMRFPGTDHTVSFYEKLPLSDGRYVGYSTALVSMPYLGSVHNMQLLPKAEAIAEVLGWECLSLPRWTWYVPFSNQTAAQSTTLILFRRKERHADTLRAWQTSFKRWAIENVGRFDRAGNPYQDAALGEVIESPHFPLTVSSFAELQEVYLNQYTHTAYQWREGVIPRGMEELFAIWNSEHKS
jgi:hypothetical protein